MACIRIFLAEAVHHCDKYCELLLQLLISGFILLLLIGMRDLWRDSGHFLGI